MTGFWASAFLHACSFSKSGPNGRLHARVKQQKQSRSNSLATEEGRTVTGVYQAGRLRFSEDAIARDEQQEVARRKGMAGSVVQRLLSMTCAKAFDAWSNLYMQSQNKMSLVSAIEC